MIDAAIAVEEINPVQNFCPNTGNLVAQKFYAGFISSTPMASSIVIGSRKTFYLETIDI
jgi:hypothetical protein